MTIIEVSREIQKYKTDREEGHIKSIDAALATLYNSQSATRVAMLEETYILALSTNGVDVEGRVQRLILRLQQLQPKPDDLDGYIRSLQRFLRV